MADGTIVIDTRIDNSGAEKGARNVKREASGIAREFQRAGQSSSNSFNRAWNNIENDSRNGSREVKNELTSISGLAKKCASVLAGVFVIDKIKDYGVSIAKAGIEYNGLNEQAQVAWSTILGSNEAANKMMEDITNYAAKTPFSKMGVDAMAKQLSNAGFEGQALFEQLDKIGDMGSAFGIQEDSLKEMVRQYSQVQQAQVAYTEDLNILQDRGIPIFKALGEVMGVPVSQIKKLASEGKITADVYNKAIDSMANKTQGAMENQSKTFNGLMSTTKDNFSVLVGIVTKPMFDKMKEDLIALQPKIDKLIESAEIFASTLENGGSVGDGLLNAMNNLFGEETTNKIVAVTNSIGACASAVAGAVLAFKALMIIQSVAAAFQTAKLNLALYTMTTQGATIAQGVLNGSLTWGETLVALLTGKITLATVAQRAWNIAMTANPIGIVIVAIGALVGAFIYLWNTSEGFRNFWIGLWEGVKNACISAWNAIGSFFTETIPGWIENIKTWFSGLPEWFGQILSSIKDFFVEKFNNIKDSIVQWGADTLVTIQNWGNNVWNFFTVTIPGWIESIGNWFGELPYRIGYALGQVIGTIIQWGINIWTYLSTNVPIWINNVVTWFSELPSRIWTWLTNTYNKVVTWGSEMCSKAIEIASTFINDIITWFSELPGRVWNWITNTYNKVVTWGSQMTSKAIEIATNFINSIVNWFKQLPSRIWNWLKDTYNKVINWGNDMANKAREIGGKFVDWLIESVKSLPSKMMSIGGDIVRGVWEGITNMGSWFMGKVGDFFGGIVDGIKSKLGIHSPSRVFRDEVGKWILPGVEVGIDKTMPDLQDNMKDKMLSLAREMKAKVEFETNSLGATLVAKSNGEIASKTISNSNNADRPLILKVENKNYLDSEEIAGHTTEKVIENIGDSQDSYTISTGGDFSFA